MKILRKALGRVLGGGDGKSTVPPWLEWVNQLNPYRSAGFVHDNLLGQRVNAFVAYLAFVATAFAVLLVALVMLVPMCAGLAVYELALWVAPKWVLTQKAKIVVKSNKRRGRKK